MKEKRRYESIPLLGINVSKTPDLKASFFSHGLCLWPLRTRYSQVSCWRFVILSFIIIVLISIYYHHSGVWILPLSWKNAHYTDYISPYYELQYKLHSRMHNFHPASPIDCPEISEPIDIVYTWVNGSDPGFQKQLQKFKAKEEKQKVKELDSRRFHDMDQLKYSLRSVELYIPWARHVYIVTNGQVPSWLNTTNDRISVVQHSEIFTNQSHLPTFSSPAIEINIHHIPGLSDRFIYLNDDFFMLRPICPSDFISEKDELLIYLKDLNHITEYAKKKKYDWKCNCDATLLGNGVCDANCNKFECLWDNHDCDNIEPKWPKYRDGRESYHQSVDFTQLVLDRKFETKVTNRTWNPHMPFMLDKRILDDISTELPIETSLTSSHQTRKKTDLQYEMLFNYYTVESPRNYSHVIMDQEPVVEYISLYDNYRMNAINLQRLRFNMKKFNCINDNLSHKDIEDSWATYRFVRQFYEDFFPNKSQFEI